MAQLDRPQRRWVRRLLGGADSWRRIALAGIVGGITLAFGAALIAALVGGGRSGSLDRETPTAVAPVAGPVDTVPPPEQPQPSTPTPETAPTEPLPPTELLPTESPTPTEPLPTEPAPEPTPTLAPEAPTPVPTLPEEGGGLEP